MNRLSVSVRKLVEFVTMGGSIDSRFVGSNIMHEGTRTHQRLQANRGTEYEKEVYLSIDLKMEACMLHIEGRCDGIYLLGQEIVIEEIKTTSRELSSITEGDFPAYWAQLKMYAFIYANEYQLEKIGVNMLFARRDSTEEKSFTKSYTLQELTSFAMDIAKEYMEFHYYILSFKKSRTESIARLTFPYKTYRKGQRDLAKAVYKTIQDEKRLFAEAATGIGKTIATLFPAVMSLKEGSCEKILYLTAKTVTRMVAEEAMQLLVTAGLSIKVVTITAKDKICFQEETICNKEFCPFADGYYDRLKAGIKDILQQEQVMSREVIEEYSRKHQLCPFEFSLDLALFADVVICDYNYYFDPKVRLQRFGEFHKESILLIDEAHNLAERAKEMYSATLTKSFFLQASREVKTLDKELYQKLKTVNDALLAWKKELLVSEEFVTEDVPGALVELLREAVAICEKWLLSNASGAAQEKVLNAYFEAQDFLRIAKEYNTNYRTIVTLFQSEVVVKLACLDPSSFVRNSTKRASATIFFSATLHPLGFYQTLLGGEEVDYHLSIDSPFSKEQLQVYARRVSTTYRDREASIIPIAKAVKEVFHPHKGNFLLFFPSYEYMSQVYTAYREAAEADGVELLVQQPAMSEREREDFLEAFTPRTTSTLIGLAVLGGIFAEGIDLKGDRLNGVGIVGVGLPALSLERNIMKNYFQAKGQNGFDFAYVFPGMNKVQQAGGRVIRSETDKGFLLLLDDRYFSTKYKNLLPKEWQQYEEI